MSAIKIIPTCYFSTEDEIKVAWAHKRKAFEAILCNQYSLPTVSLPKIAKCLIIIPPLNKQQRESEISEISVTQKSLMWKKKLQHNTPGIETGAVTKMVAIFIKIEICFYTFPFSLLQ